MNMKALYLLPFAWIPLICSEVLQVTATLSSFITSQRTRKTKTPKIIFQSRRTRRQPSSQSLYSTLDPSTLKDALDYTMNKRHACTRFQRFDGLVESTITASPSNETIVSTATQCLELARRAPTGFNAQPYKILLVSSPAAKEAVARHCIGGNAYRVRDSDCTAIFLADRESMRTLRDYESLLLEGEKHSASNSKKKKLIQTIKVYIGLFSSGLPLPRFFASPISFIIRSIMSFLAILTGRFYPLPTLTAAETWATKNTMLVAMAYMIIATANGLSTCPMEGFNGGGIKNALKIPRRYSVPLLVSTGLKMERPVPSKTESSGAADNVETEKEVGDVLKHGDADGTVRSPRYSREQVIYSNTFGAALA